MMGRNRTRKGRVLAGAVVGLAVVIALAVAGGAGAKSSVTQCPCPGKPKFSQKQIAKVSAKRLAGHYEGTTEDGLPMSFTLTRQKQIVNLVEPLTLYCRTYTDNNHDGFITSDEGVLTTRPFTFMAPPVPIKSGTKPTSHYPLGFKFEGSSPTLADSAPPLGTYAEAYLVKAQFKEELLNGSQTGRPTPRRAAGIRGEVFFASRTGPLTPKVSGEEICVLTPGEHVRAIDFDAKKVGK